MMAPLSNGHKKNEALPFLVVGSPAAAHPPPEVPELAGVLSPSQCSLFLGCSAKWFYRYVMQIGFPAGFGIKEIGESHALRCSREL